MQNMVSNIGVAAFTAPWLGEILTPLQRRTSNFGMNLGIERKMDRYASARSDPFPLSGPAVLRVLHVMASRLFSGEPLCFLNKYICIYIYICCNISAPKGHQKYSDSPDLPRYILYRIFCFIIAIAPLRAAVSQFTTSVPEKWRYGPQINTSNSNFRWKPLR